MDTDAILVCGRIGVIVSDDPLSDLRRLKNLRNIFRGQEKIEGERVYALKMKNGDVRAHKLLKQRRRILKNCRILGLMTGWIFFIAAPDSAMKLLGIPGVHLHDMTEMEIQEYTGGRKR